jgi:Calcineurin-like phosphoesterase
MTHEIVAIGDLHLQSTHPRNQARLDALDAVINDGLALPALAAWVLLGDLFHGRSSPADRAALAERLQRMATAAPVCALVGNHEQTGDTTIFSKLSAAWPIAVADQPIVIQLPTPTSAILTVACLPYPSRGGLIAAGTTADQTLQVGDEYLRDILRSFGVGLAGAALPLFAGHINIGGAVVSSGQPNIGRELELDVAALDLLGDVPKVLGHIHAPQEIGGAWYAGSICPMDFGEHEAKRTVVIRYTDDRGAWEHELESRPVDTPRLFRARGVLSREGFTLEPSADYPESWAGCEVKVTYTFAASERNVLDHSLVRVPFESALRLEIEPVAVPDRALRAPEVAAAKTLADKVQAWAALSGATVTDEVTAKLAALEHQDAAQMLSAVANQIAALEHAEKDEKAA